MTSQVNPNNIDGTYPVAGQDNDSQGFRDNFTNIRNNFTFIKAEIEDIQNNGQTGITFDYVDKTGYESRWMEAPEAEKVAKWQYARDYFHQILLGELDPDISAHDKYFDLYNR